MAGHANPRSWPHSLLFQPEHGQIVREPPGGGAGYWAGAPGAWYERGEFYLVYRLRRPRGVDPDRGAEVRIARSRDGLAFEDLWRGTKGELGSTSIERCALVHRDGRPWVLYVSYVDPADGRWRIDQVEANRPDAFDLRQARPALTAAHIGAEGVKDPFVFWVEGRAHMIVSYAIAARAVPAGALHGTADAYNTGLIRSATGLATSHDGLQWTWTGPLLEPPAQGWDRYCTRIGCLWNEPPVWLALYDGSADVSENYEERCGLAWSTDLRTFHRASQEGPIVVSPQGSGSLRYVDVLALADARYFYYEMARADGSHDLRVLRVAREAATPEPTGAVR